MNSLRLTLRAPHDGRLDLSGVVPDRLLPLTAAEIAQLPISARGRTAALGDYFDIEDGARDKLVLGGDLQQVDSIGAAMRDGLLVVEGSVGNRLATNMRGGHIIVQGNAGQYASSGQRGGYVLVEGNAQDYCAAALPGERAGMRGGTLRVAGRVGRFLGARMRRGSVIVGGDVAEGCASSLVAGTIICCRAVAAPLAVSMRRGTIVCLTAEPPLGVGFTAPEQIRLSYLHLLFDALAPQLPELPSGPIAHQPLWRSLGDRACGGTGEILWPLTIASSPREA
jgi:formylmethanofuran dehydrogenase subunit C